MKKRGVGAVESPESRVIADIARDRKGKGKTLPLMNADQEVCDRERRNL
jgi:hypothetical protein